MKFVKILSLVFISIFLTAFTYNKHHFHYDFPNAFSRTLLSILEDTVWANDFSESKFSKIKIGMTKDEVVKILGLPLERHCEKDSCLLAYSKQKDGVSSFDRRDVFLDKANKTIKVARDFWID